MAVVKWHDKEYGTTNFFLHKYSYTGLRVAAVWLPHIDKLFLWGAVEQTKPHPPFPMRRTVHLQEWNKFCLLSSPGLFILPISPGTQFRPRSQTPSFMLEPGSPFTPKVCWTSFPWKRGKKWKVLQTTGIIDSTVHFTQLGLHRVTASFEQSLKVNCLGPPSFESSYWNKIVQTYPTEVTHRQVACLNPPFPV